MSEADLLLRKRQRTIESNKQERVELFGPDILENPFENRELKRNLKDEDEARKLATHTTGSLARSQTLLLNTVSQSAMTLEQLGQSSTKVDETREELVGQGATIGTSKSLLAKYGRRELTDRLLIFLALIMFLGVVFYIIRKRL